MPGIPTIQTARLRALRGQEDPSLSIQTQDRQRLASQTLPVRPTQQRPARPTVPTATPIQPQRPVQPLPVPQIQPRQQTTQPRSEFVNLALQQGVLPATRRAATTLAQLRAQQDFEQTLL